MGFLSQAMLAPQGRPPIVAFVDPVNDHPYRDPADVFTAADAALSRETWLEAWRRAISRRAGGNRKQSRYLRDEHSPIRRVRAQDRSDHSVARH